MLGAAAIETVPGGYRLALDGDEVDGFQFEHLIDRGRVLRATGEVDRAAAAYARALSLWRGRPLEELDGWLPGQSEAARLEELRRTTEEDWLDCRLASGEHREVVAEGQALVTAEPLRERRWAILALAQYRCGRQADALRSLTRARRTLADDLGIDPGPELVALEGAILRQDTELSAVPEAAAASDACPYKGLASYDVGDEETFFGRDVEIAACLERLGSTPLLLVTGPSGCGKSSLVRAGLVPALRRRGQTVVIFVPGADPEAAMDTAIAEVDGPAVLVIDQFEELLALGHPPDVVHRFCRRVATHASDVAPVIMAVRSDHLGGLGTEPRLSRLAEQGLHLVAPLAGDALREAIEAPAALAGLRLEHGLVELLVRDCEGEPGGLPLLSHALAETWRRRDGNVLTVEGYRATGGIRGAVARSADRLYDTLPGTQRAVLRSVLLRLVTPSLDGEPVRCRVSSRSLLDDPDRERIVGLLVRARLVTSEKETFELAHEALARAWPRLQSWLDDDVAGQRLLRHLTSAAEGWESLGRPETELYRGARLDTALEWQEVSEPHLTELEQQFLTDSVDQASSETRAIAERARRDARQNRRLRSLLGATAILLFASLVVGYFAIRQREEATSERHVATSRELAAAANANVTVDPERSVLLALAAVEESRSGDGRALPEAEEALHRAVTADQIELRVPGVGGALAWSPNGQVFVTEGPQSSGVVDIRDARTGASVRSFHGHDLDVTDVAFNHDGTLLATTGADGAARVWDPATGEEQFSIESPSHGVDCGNHCVSGGAWGPSFSQDGSWFAAAWPDEDGGVVRILDLESGRIVNEIDRVPVPVATSFDPDAARLAVASGVLPIAVVLDVESGAEAVQSHRPLRHVAGRRLESRRLDDRDGGRGRQRPLVRRRDRATAVRPSRPCGGGRRGRLEPRLQATDHSQRGRHGQGVVPDRGRWPTALQPVRPRPGGRDPRCRVLTRRQPGHDRRRRHHRHDHLERRGHWGRGGRQPASRGVPPRRRGLQCRRSPRRHHRAVEVGSGSGIRRRGRSCGPSGPRTTPPPSGLPGVPLAGDEDVATLAVDPSGQLVAAVRGVGEGTVDVWELESGQLAFAVPIGDGVRWPAWSPDGQLLAIVENAGDGDHRRPIGRRSHHPGPSRSGGELGGVHRRRRATGLGRPSEGAVRPGCSPGWSSGTGGPGRSSARSTPRRLPSTRARRTT